MQRLHLHLRHETFADISDRSARQILKSLSKAVRAAQLSDARDFIFSLDLDYSLLRSMEDHLTSEAERIPAYYLERLEKGSLVLWAVVSAGPLAFLAKIGLDRIIDDEDLRRDLLEKIQRHLDTWHQGLLPKILGELRGRGLGSHIEVDDAKVETDGKITRANIALSSDRDEDLPPPIDYTPGSLEDFLNDELGDGPDRA